VFPSGTSYGQFKEGGTSLASPLLAGVVADADQAAGGTLGFLNPILYTAWSKDPSGFIDVVSPANPDSASVIRVDFANTVDTTDGYNISLRTIDYQGPQEYCDTTHCITTTTGALSTAKGFDSMTGLGTISPKFLSVLSKF
jgi:subtilase family serine protease